MPRALMGGGVMHEQSTIYTATTERPLPPQDALTMPCAHSSQSLRHAVTLDTLEVLTLIPRPGPKKVPSP